MFVISQNALKWLKQEKYAVRINVAWEKNIAGLKKTIKKFQHYDIYLDIPTGRFKPPVPKIPIKKLIPLINKSLNIKYVAISNVENNGILKFFLSNLCGCIKLVPKIESEKGVKNVIEICKGITDTVMLDKEDLYLDVKQNNRKYGKLVKKVRSVCAKNRIKVLELRGVIFG